METLFKEQIVSMMLCASSNINTLSKQIKGSYHTVERNSKWISCWLAKNTLIRSHYEISFQHGLPAPKIAANLELRSFWADLFDILHFFLHKLGKAEIYKNDIWKDLSEFLVMINTLRFFRKILALFVENSHILYILKFFMNT